MFEAIASGDIGFTVTSSPLIRSGKSIMPISSISSSDRRTIGNIVSLISRPKAAPRFCDNSFIRSTISVALLALMLSGGRLSSSNVFLIANLKSLATIWDKLESPDRGKGCRDGPLGPPFEPTPITAPGTIEIACGFNTPSSTAVNTPPIEMLAFFRVNSTTLLSVLMSGRA